MNAINTVPPDHDGGERDDRHVRMLRELAEMTMALARATARKALRQQEGEAAPGAPDPTLLFARLSREIRETIKLEAGIAAGREPAQPGGSVRAPRARTGGGGGGGGHAGDDGDLGERRRVTLLRLLTAAVEADRTIADPGSFVPDIEAALDEPEVAASIRAGAPFQGIIEQVCDELGIEFDYKVLPDHETTLAAPPLADADPN